MKDIEKQLDIQKQLYEHRKDLCNKLDIIVLTQAIADDIHNKTNDLLRNLDLLGEDTTMILCNDIFSMEKHTNQIRRYLDQRYNITSREIETLHQIIIGDTTSDDTTSDDITINPEYIEEFEEMLSDGDVPFWALKKI